MTKKTLKKIAVGAMTLSAAALPMFALAQDLFGINQAAINGLGTKDVRTTISGVITGFMGLLGIVAVIIILLGGFKWMTSQGEEEKVSEAKKLIVAGVIGLVIITIAYAAAQFVVGTVLNASR